ncbi:AraC family transcriptional regulator [Shewanella psychrophila]|nr:AraC family transcriptional regulator [Shewanella psychrophila]
MPDKSRYSTISAWAIAVSRALSASGVDAYGVFDNAGLCLDEVESAPDSRIAIERMTRLWSQAEQATGSAAFGLTVGQYAYPMHFRSLGLLMMTSATLAQAFEALPNYSALVSNSASIKLQRTPDRLGFTITPLPGVDISPMSIDAFFATLVHHGELILGHGKFVLSVELMRVEPKDIHSWQSCFSCPISFNKQENCLWMDRSTLEHSAVMGNPILAAQNETKVRDYLDKMQALKWQEKTSQAIHAMLVSGEPKAHMVAQVYNISERTLSRKLKEEGTSFRDLLQQKRKELAYHYLMNTELSITLLSDKLGYTSLTNFSRAFHRWHGSSPVSFRIQSKSLQDSCINL